MILNKGMVRRKWKRSKDKKDTPNAMVNRRFEDTWDFLVMRRTAPEQWSDGCQLLYNIRTIGEFWGTLNNVRLKVGVDHHRFMNSPEGFALFKEGLRPSWNTGGIGSQCVVIKANLDEKGFHHMLNNLCVLLVCNMDYIPGALGVRVCDKTNKYRFMQRAELWGRSDNTQFAGCALSWMNKLMKECGCSIVETQVNVHSQMDQ